MRNLIKKILNESIGGNYFFLIVTKDGRFYVSDGDDWDYADMLIPMDGTLSYDELDKLHNPKSPTRLYKDKDRAEKALQSMKKFYHTPEERKQSRGWSDRWTQMIENFNSDMHKNSITWDDFEIQQYYLGLIPATTSI